MKLLLLSTHKALSIFATANLENMFLRFDEGIAFGCKTLLLDLPGIEFMEELFGQKSVQKLDPDKDFEYPPVEGFDAAHLGAQLFAPDWEQNLEVALTKVLGREDYGPGR
ncbi:MAG: hypothetical protein AAF202_03470 [Pseudomonadota bacterium]